MQLLCISMGTHSVWLRFKSHQNFAYFSISAFLAKKLSTLYFIWYFAVSGEFPKSTKWCSPLYSLVQSLILFCAALHVFYALKFTIFKFRNILIQFCFKAFETTWIMFFGNSKHQIFHFIFAHKFGITFIKK